VIAAPWPATDPTFPQQLTGLTSSPRELHTIGDRATIDAPCVAIVGTRHPTSYGERVTVKLATVLVEAGACVVSGMASGIDGVAHRAALAANGRTAAILGTSIDQPYPLKHTKLYESIGERGLIISEFADRRPTFAGAFPRRNRIIAGLSTLTVVIEAGQKSGALITANYALSYNRTVAAVPGPIDSPQSAGTNRLISEGANVITTPDDVLLLLGMTNAHVSTKSEPELSGDMAMVWSALQPGRDTDAIIAATGLTASRCSVAITMLEMRGLVVCTLSGELQKRV
jgi:DNA processing protein